MTKNGQTYATNWNYFTLFGRSGRFCEYYRQEMCLVVYPKNHHFALHPLIHTLLEFNLAQVTSFFQRDERKMPPLTSDGLWGLREVGQD
jgi:hypothetical protein